MKFPSSLTTVTHLSKILALFLFLLFPIVGFFLGMQYQALVTEPTAESLSVPTTLVRKTTLTPHLSSQPYPTLSSNQDETARWKTYKDPQLKYEFLYPPDPLEPQRMEGDTSFVVGYPIKEEYRNDPNLVKSASAQDKTFWIILGYISQAQLNVMGVAYCSAYPNDVSRCESANIGGINSMIDWSITVPFTRITKEGKQVQDMQIKASVWIPHPNGGIITFELQPVVPESKAVFHKILSTFKFSN